MLLYLVSVVLFRSCFSGFSHLLCIISHFVRPLFMYFYYLIEEMHHPHGVRERRHRICMYMCA